MTKGGICDAARCDLLEQSVAASGCRLHKSTGLRDGGGRQARLGAQVLISACRNACTRRSRWRLRSVVAGVVESRLRCRLQYRSLRACRGRGGAAARSPSSQWWSSRCPSGAGRSGPTVVDVEWWPGRGRSQRADQRLKSCCSFETALSPEWTSKGSTDFEAGSAGCSPGCRTVRLRVVVAAVLAASLSPDWPWPD